MSSVSFLTRPPSALLEGAVRELWQLEDEGRLHAGLPKPYVELVVSISGIHWWRAAPAAAEHRYVDAWVTPVQTGPRYARSLGCRRLIGARLEPWAARALFGPLPLGTGAPPPRLSQLVGPDARILRSTILRADSSERFDAFMRWLEEQPALRQAARLSARPDNESTAAELARRQRLSARSLRRAFAREAGIAPKQWLRLHRLDRVLRDRARSSSGPSLAAVAQEHGYADQAHFTRDVTALTGVTPRRLRERSEQLPPHMYPIE